MRSCCEVFVLSTDFLLLEKLLLLFLYEFKFCKQTIVFAVVVVVVVVVVFKVLKIQLLA